MTFFNAINSIKCNVNICVYDSDVYERPCSTDVDCSHNAECNKIKICECKEGFFQRALGGVCIGEFIPLNICSKRFKLNFCLY